jgi:hypothetical protein
MGEIQRGRVETVLWGENNEDCINRVEIAGRVWITRAMSLRFCKPALKNCYPASYLRESSLYRPIISRCCEAPSPNLVETFTNRFKNQ